MVEGSNKFYQRGAAARFFFALLMLVELFQVSGKILRYEMGHQGTILDLKKEIARSCNVSRESPVILVGEAILGGDVLLRALACREPLPDWCVIDDIIAADVIMPYACLRFALIFNSLVCARCGTMARKMLRCEGREGKRCVARYCDDVCQTADWAAHKPLCSM